MSDPVFIVDAREDKEAMGIETLSVIDPALSKTLFALLIVLRRSFKIKNT
jgi:hypothetical protein